MAELSERSGVAVATVKYYLREGLLQPGERTSPNQARYADKHVRRLKLIRALVEVGGMSIADVRAVLAAADAPDVSTHRIVGTVLESLPSSVPDTADEEGREWAAQRLHAAAAEQGWQIPDERPAMREAIELLCAMRELGQAGVADRLGSYASAATRIADADMATVREPDVRGSVESVVTTAVVNTVLGDALLVRLRRIAQEEASARMFGLR